MRMRGNGAAESRTDDLSGQGRVLIADRSAAFRGPTAELLREAGYECDQAADAAAARRRLRGGEYDLLIADATMAGDASPAPAGSLLATAAGLPVIVVTGRPALRSALASIEMGAAAYLIKPVDGETLLKKTRGAVKRARALRAVRALQDRLKRWCEDLDAIEEAVGAEPLDLPESHRQPFTALALQNVAECLACLTRALPPAEEALVLNGGGRARALRPWAGDGRARAEDPDGNARTRRLERAVHRIARDLEEAGIIGALRPALLAPGATDDLSNLSPREWDVLRRLIGNQRVATIARSLSISPHTVRNHLKSVFRKFGVRSQTELLERVGGRDEWR